MLITAASLNVLFLGLNTTLSRAMAGADGPPPLHSQLCMKSQSNGKSELYPFLGDLPLVEEAAEGAPVKVQNLIPSDFQIDNVDLKRVIGISENDLRDDKEGIYTQRIAEVGEATSRAIDYMLARRMVAGFTTLRDYTGKFYFDAAKPVNRGSEVVFTNRGTNKLSVARYEAALENLMGRADAQNVSLNLGGSKTVLVVSSRNRALGQKIVEAPLVAGGETNANYKASELKVWGYLDQLLPDAWFLFSYDQARKPFILQERQAFTTSMTTDPNDSHVVKNEEFLYKIKGRLNIGGGESLLAWGSTGFDPA